MEPDGKTVVASLANPDTDFVNLYRIPLDAPQQAERLTTQPDFGQYPLSWSSATNAILYVEGTRPGTQSDIFSLDLGTRQTRPLVVTPTPDGSPTFSKDGRWFAYASRLQSGSEIFLQRFDQSSPPRKIASGLDPLWSADGKSVHFLTEDGSLMEIPVSTTDGSAGRAKVLATGLSGLPTGWWGQAYSSAPDGRFLVIRNVATTQARSEIHIVVNWLEEVKRAVP